MPTHSNSATPVRAPQEPRGLCALVVEDDEADAYLISRALGDNPAVETVVRARDGVEALAMVERGDVKPDVAFIDLHMPRMDGFDLLVAFAMCATPRFPMVVLTSSAAPNDAIRSRLRRAMRVVTKPDNVADLHEALATAVDALCPPKSETAISEPGRPAGLLVGERFAGLSRAAAVDEVGR
jgi:CheY-like chemotaxis protein